MQILQKNFSIYKDQYLNSEAIYDGKYALLFLFFISEINSESCFILIGRVIIVIKTASLIRRFIK